MFDSLFQCVFCNCSKPTLCSLFHGGLACVLLYSKITISKHLQANYLRSHHLGCKLQRTLITPPTPLPNKYIINIILVCKLQLTLITPPTPPPPFQTNTSSTEEPHLKNIILVCKLQRTLITPPHPPHPPSKIFQTNTSPTEEHHLKNITFVCKQQRTTITTPHPPTPPNRKTCSSQRKKFKNARKHTDGYGTGAYYFLKTLLVLVPGMTHFCPAHPSFHSVTQ